MYSQLRKAIEDVNSGNMQPSTADADELDASAPTINGNDMNGDVNAILSEKAVLAGQEQPLLGNNNTSTKNNYNNNNHQKSKAPMLTTVDDETITSNDSQLSNSDNCSDMEMQYIDDTTPTPKTPKTVQTMPTETETDNNDDDNDDAAQRKTVKIDRPSESSA